LANSNENKRSPRGPDPAARNVSFHVTGESTELAQPPAVSGPADPPPADAMPIKPRKDRRPSSVAELHAAIEELKKTVEAAAEVQTRVMAARPVSAADSVNRFFSSGLFFILLGLVFLLVANVTMGTAHAAFSFVLVVLGVAVLLYGTGTQGMGEFQTSSAAAKYNVAIAGGAGILAFCVAMGIIQYSPAMKTAFQVEKKYVRLLIQGGNDGSSHTPRYASEFSIDGIPIPSVRRGDLIEVMIPYFASDLISETLQIGDGTARADPMRRIAECKYLSATAAPAKPDDKGDNKDDAKVEQVIRKTITATFYRVRTDDFRPTNGEEDSALERELKDNFQVRIGKSSFYGADGGYDFPTYPERMCVNLQSRHSINTLSDNARKRTLGEAPGREPPGSGLPPALIIPQ
jgi:hypothetical protein